MLAPYNPLEKETIPLDESFWKEHKGLVALDGAGRVYFTRKGRELYQARLSRYGLALPIGQPVADFRAVLAELERREREAQREKYRDALADPATPEDEKVYLRRLLGIEPEMVRATVLSLSEARRRRDHHDKPGQTRQGDPA